MGRFSYLGNIISEDGGSTEDVTGGIAEVESVF